MGPIEVDWRPEDRKLRQFAVACAGALGMIGLLACWRQGVLGGAGLRMATIVLWALGAAVGLVGVILPGAIKPIYLAGMCVALPAGWVVSHLVLAGIYFLVFTPVALVFRLIGRDLMCRRLDRSIESYWVERAAAPSAKRYFRQF